jgi:NAD(P)-dependent dehydrogenase (short-subunit alcohol dehydrogenase family)
MSALAGKVAIVTGGTSGIGAAIATLFIAEGARVVIAGRRRDKGEQVAATLGEAASFIRTDVCIEDDVAAMVWHAVERFGRLDCLVNNAGNGSQRVGTADIHQKCHHALADTGSATQQPSLRQSPLDAPEIQSYQDLRRVAGNRGKTPGADAFFVCVGSEQSDSSYV